MKEEEHKKSTQDLNKQHSKLLDDFTLYFTPLETGAPSELVSTPKGQTNMSVTQAGRVLFIVPLRYLFAIGLQYIMDEHHYLAFDVSLPPLNNLSCSPKQLDSDSWHMNRQAIPKHVQNVTVTLYGKRKGRIPTKS